MNPKVRVFNALPEFAKHWATSCYIPYRSVIETAYAGLYARLDQAADDKLRAVYITGFPRSGTSVMKYYFSQYPGLKMQAFDPAGFQVTWGSVRNREEKTIRVDKSNHYVQSPGKIFKGCGARAAICCMVRDPRDSFLSLMSFPEAREVPRDKGFWEYWHQTYRNFLDFAERSPLGDRIFFLRMEDFSAHPVEAKAKYLSWLGLDVGQSPIDDTYVLPEKQEFVSDKVHAWSAITTEPAERWRKSELSTEIEQLLTGWRDHQPAAALMSELGYAGDKLEPIGIRSDNFHIFRPEARNVRSTA